MQRSAAENGPPRRRAARMRWVLRALFVVLLALVVAVCALWQWPAGFYGFSTFLGRIACGVRLESIVVNGTPVATLTSSEKENATPILFLHGYGTSKEAMLMQMRWFSRSRRVIAPDLPGFGENPLAKDAAPLTGEQYVKWIENFRVAANIPRVDLVGESMGGALAAAYAATYPGAVRRIVLQSPAGLKPTRMNAVMHSLEQGENPLDVRTEEDFDEALKLCFVHPPPVPGPIRAHLTRKSAERVANHPEMLRALGPFLLGGVTDLLGSIEAPTLVLFGDQDQITDCSMLTAYVEGVRGAEGMLIRGAGHVIFSDAPGEVRAAVTEFLDRRETETTKTISPAAR